MELFKRILIILIFLAFFVLVLTFPGCKTIEKIEYRTIYDTCYVSKIEHDSVFVKDSVYIYSKSDTVYYIKFKERVKYLTRTDTIFKSSVDTLYVNKEIVKEVEKKRPVRDFLAKFCIINIIGFILILAIYLKFKN